MVIYIYTWFDEIGWLCNQWLYFFICSLNPYGLDSSPICGDLPGGNAVSVEALPLLATSTQDYDDSVSRTITLINNVYHEFIRSEEGLGFNGQVCILGKIVLIHSLNIFCCYLLYGNGTRVECFYESFF